MDAVFDDGFVDGLVGIVVELVADMDTAVFANGLVWQ